MPELYPGPDLDLPIPPKDPEVLAEREGIHERIQAELQLEDKETEVFVEEMLEAPPAWKEVPDLMMVVEEKRMMPEAPVKQKMEELTQGWRKWRREEEIRLEKHEHSPQYLGGHKTQQDSISRSCTQHQGGRCSICEAKVDLGGRIDKRSMKYHPSTLQGGEDYPTVSKLYLANREMKIDR